MQVTGFEYIERHKMEASVREKRSLALYKNLRIIVEVKYAYKYISTMTEEV
jgi:hypothetical protein